MCCVGRYKVVRGCLLEESAYELYRGAILEWASDAHMLAGAKAASVKAGTLAPCHVMSRHVSAAARVAKAAAVHVEPRAPAIIQP